MTLLLPSLCRGQLAQCRRQVWRRAAACHAQQAALSTDAPEIEESRPNFAKKRRLSPIERARLENLSGWRRRLEEDKMTKFGPWRPEKRVARSTMEQMRLLHKQFPDKYDIKALSAQYNVSFEAVRRILHSKFEPTSDVIERQERKRDEQRKRYVDELMSKRRGEEREAAGEKDGEHDAASRPRKSSRSPKLSEFDAELEKEAEKINPLLTRQLTGTPIYKAVQREIAPGEEKWQQKVRASRAKRFAMELGITEDEIAEVRGAYRELQKRKADEKQKRAKAMRATSTEDDGDD